MVGPPAQHVVGPLLPDLACNRFLAAHGIEGYDAALQAQHAQQFRDDRACVGLVVHGRLGQHQPVGLRPGAAPGRGSRARTT